jgi:uncharacterized lipoprotein YmbA
MIRQPALAALTFLLLAGCGTSPPTRYFSLAPVAGAIPPMSDSAVAPIRVDAVTVPAELDRPQIVRRIDETRLDIAGFDRWAAPLDEQIRRVLSDDLATRLPGRVIDPTAPAVPAEILLVALDVDRFDAGADGTVTLAANWALVSAGRAVERHAEIIRQEGAGPDPDSAPAAMSRALGTLADRIAARLAKAADR